ncbi:hypothetical protein AHAS_Ahas16G0076000 [Arachis hypogaea]
MKKRKKTRVRKSLLKIHTAMALGCWYNVHNVKGNLPKTVNVQVVGVHKKERRRMIIMVDKNPALQCCRRSLWKKRMNQKHPKKTTILLH